jgi:hypothetical protein
MHHVPFARLAGAPGGNIISHQRAALASNKRICHCAHNSARIRHFLKGHTHGDFKFDS